MFTRWRLPPDSVLSSSRARSRSPVCSSIRSTAASGSATFSRRANSRRFSATESFEYTAGCWGTQPTSAGGRETSPASARSSPPSDRQQRRLARAVGPDHRDQLAVGGLEAHVAQRDAIAEALGHAAHVHVRDGTSSRSSSRFSSGPAGSCGAAGDDRRRAR